VAFAVCEYQNFLIHFTYSGDSVIQDFFSNIKQEQTEIDAILSTNRSMNPLTNEERLVHNTATICLTCESHHCHITGQCW